MSTNWNSADVKCPYYKTETKNSISCESMIKYSDMITLKFETIEKKKEHMENHCNTNYNSCSICTLANKKYGQ